jgi:hypothetical protein
MYLDIFGLRYFLIDRGLEKKQGEEGMKDLSCSWMIWGIVVILTLAIGIYAGYRVMKAISDVKVMDLESELETANASLAEANVELAFWKSTLKGLADGDQLKPIGGRPSKGD